MSKQEFRKALLFHRKLMIEETYRIRNELLQKKVFLFLDPFVINQIHTFLPIKRNREPDTFPIVDHFRKLGKTVLISKTNVEKQVMTHFIFDDTIQLKEGNFKIPEPISGTEISPENIDVILVPLLGVDKAGNRIGYGAGYYDRLLKEIGSKSKKVGLSLSAPVDFIPFSESHDIRLDHLITPFQTYTFK